MPDFRINDPVQYRDTFDIGTETIETVLNGFVIDILPDRKFQVKVWFPELQKEAPNGLTFDLEGRQTESGSIVLFHK